MTTFERPSDREVIFSRLLDAPRELAWKVWSDVQHLHQWWGPAGFTTTTHEFQFVPNGEWRFIMHGPNGIDYYWRRVTSLRRLVGFARAARDSLCKYTF